MRRVASLLLAAAVLVALPACGKPDTPERKLRRFIDATDRLAFNFTYSLEKAGEVQFVGDEPRLGKVDKTVVRGVIEDDFRFKALVQLGDTPTFEKVVDDDAIAVRFLDPSRIEKFVDKPMIGRVKTTTDIKDVSVVDALRSGRWVIDAEGAPSQTVAGTADRELGVDPVTDALGVFAYVRQAVNDALTVQKFSKDALDPAYRTSEDSFPAPEEGSGVDRYDLRRPKLPAAGGSSASGTGNLPEAKHFRKMAIYVKNGRIIQILERVELTGRGVGDFLTYNRTLLRSNDVPEESIKEFDEAIKDIPEDKLGPLLLALYAANAGQFGRDPVRPRVMSLDLTDLGEANRTALPLDNVVKGSLAILVGAGRKPAETAGGAQAPGVTTTSAPPADGSTTTSPPPTSAP